MFPRVLKFSDLSYGIPLLHNGETPEGVNLSEEESPSNDYHLADSPEGEEEVLDGSDVACENGLPNGEISSDDGDQSVKEIPFCAKSIEVAASSIGISKLSRAVTETIANELAYKVRELLFTSKMIVHQNKQETMTRSDVSKSISLLGGANLFGHVFNEKENYIHIPEEDIYVPEDEEVETIKPALAETEFHQRSEPYIQGQWLLPDGYPPETNNEPCSYYHKLSKAIITGKPNQLKLILRDLQSNPKIGPYCPYFLNLVALTVKKVQGYSRDIPLTNALISTAHAIAHNRFVEPSPYLAVNRAANSLLKIVIEDVIHENFDDLAMRVRAGLLLAKMIKIWTIELKQQVDIIRHLLQYLFDSSVPLQSHYGAIVTLAALDERTLDFNVCPVMEAYLPMLDSPQYAKNSIMVQYIVGAILSALRITRNKGHRVPNLDRKLAQMEELLYSRFGDSVVPLRNAWLEGKDPIVSRGTPTREPYKLRLTIHHNRLIDPARSWTDVRTVFDIPHRFPRNPAKLPKAVYFDSSTVRWKPFTYSVARKLNFVKRQHLTSPAGDLLINL